MCSPRLQCLALRCTPYRGGLIICQLLLDIVRAFFPSWFPKASTPEQDLGPLTVVLTRLEGKTEAVGEDVKSIKNVVQGPTPEPQESIVELVSDVRTELRETALERRNQHEQLMADVRGLRTDVQALVKREDVQDATSKGDQVLQVLTKMLDRLPEPVSAFPKAPGTGMHGPPSG
ncbi:uncharacterized protein C8A04DRAFT_14684 [Dichotomopilus funicola]|uniref:Uncharacterized protein n=1 Tax=Dichotomopilus funicola TaxID=1934379 RepID=A0AAN6ZJH0_9PEZI|nr:hypothetical protein C8A04DRAFT_14684 [Dichotomopilus funicola]